MVQTTSNTNCIVFGVGFSRTKHTTNKPTTTDLSSRGFLLQIADLKIVVVYNASGKRGQAVAEGHSACAQSGMCRERGLPCRGGLCRALMVLIVVYACVFFMVSICLRVHVCVCVHF